jgi:hypothetical protein
VLVLLTVVEVIRHRTPDGHPIVTVASPAALNRAETARVMRCITTTPT